MDNQYTSFTETSKMYKHKAEIISEQKKYDKVQAYEIEYRPIYVRCISKIQEAMEKGHHSVICKKTLKGKYLSILTKQVKFTQLQESNSGYTYDTYVEW